MSASALCKPILFRKCIALVRLTVPTCPNSLIVQGLAAKAGVDMVHAG